MILVLESDLLRPADPAETRRARSHQFTVEDGGGSDGRGLLVLLEEFGNIFGNVLESKRG